MLEKLGPNVLILLYFVFLIYAFQRGRKWRLKRKEQKLIQELNKYFDPIPKTNAGKIKWNKINQELTRALPNPEVEKLLKAIEEYKKDNSENK